MIIFNLEQLQTSSLKELRLVVILFAYLQASQRLYYRQEHNIIFSFAH